MEEHASFDQAASAYDKTFTDSTIGKAQRKRVYHWLDQANFLGDNKRIFEINCGTGYDAEYFHNKGIKVVATDGSPEMIKVARSLRSEEIEFSVLDFAKVNEKTIQGENIFSNFGGLNCLNDEELSTLMNRISSAQQKGDKLALVIMPKYCLMEGLYFFFRLKWGKLFRRSSKSGLEVNVDGKGVWTFYHSPKAVRKMLPDYTINLTKPVALCLPPSYLEPFFHRRPSFLGFLSRMEKVLGRISVFSGWCDHYILVAEKQ
ncbi:MAG: class I SAM-dependent methyltransferase [Crocinitomicaceae bacterium]